MTDRRYDNAATSSPVQTLSIITTPYQDTDGVSSSGETTYCNPRWTEFNGYYRKNQGGSKAAITKYATWIVGKGFKTDARTKKILEGIKGFGKDSFKGIIANALRVKKINGDSFTEIITKDRKPINRTGSNLLNLKPLNPGMWNTVANEKGIVIGYEQHDKENKRIGKRYKPEEIFHLSNDREADEIHGISCYEGSTDTLDKIAQLDEDMTKVFHRYVMPMLKWKLDTEEQSEINGIMAKADKAQNEGRNIFIPEGATEVDPLMIPQFSTIDPIVWRKEWSSEAIKDLGIPELVLGSADGTVDASAKMVYLAFEQPIADEQEEIETQIRNQLHLEVKAIFPAKIEDNVEEDSEKDGKLEGEKKSDVGATKIKKEAKNPSNTKIESKL